MNTGNNTAGKTAPERYVSEKAFEELPDAFQKLAELLGEDQFELVAVNEKDSQDIYVQDGEIRLVYLMNDAVESFLVFGNASRTAASIIHRAPASPRCVTAFIISFKIVVCSVCSQSKNCNSNTICFFLRAFFLSLFCLYIFRLAIAAVIAVSMLFPAISSKYSQCFLQYVTAARSHTLSIPVIFLTKEDADETSSTSLSISAEYVKNGTLYFSASETTAGSSFFRSILTSASI